MKRMDSLLRRSDDDVLDERRRLEQVRCQAGQIPPVQRALIQHALARARARGRIEAALRDASDQCSSFARHAGRNSR